MVKFPFKWLSLIKELFTPTSLTTTTSLRNKIPNTYIAYFVKNTFIK